LLVLVRHGQSEGNLAGALLGRRDAPLTELGRRQARATGQFLRETGLRPDVICSSPLVRARHTAEIICAELARVGTAPEVVEEPRIVEVDYGELEGIRMEDVDALLRARWRADPGFCPPSGEALVEVQERVGAWCDELAAAEPRVVVAVTHVSPIKAAAIWALSCGPELTWRMSLGIASITRLSLEPRSLISFGESGHLARVEA
jgi:probable phosphoglycerate mutase